jgi:hypothetical protein
MVPFADVVFGMDTNFWKEYGERAHGDFELWTSSTEASRIFNLYHIRAEPGGGVSGNPGAIRHGGNSGFMSIGLAIHFGAAWIGLLGFDLQDTNGRLHFHRDHPEHIGNPRRDRFKAWRKHFAELASQAPVPIVNLSRQTALLCFPRATIQDYIGITASVHEGLKA